MRQALAHREPQKNAPRGGADSGPSQFDPFRAAIRPTPAVRLLVTNVALRVELARSKLLSGASVPGASVAFGLRPQCGANRLFIGPISKARSGSIPGERATPCGRPSVRFGPLPFEPLPERRIPPSIGPAARRARAEERCTREALHVRVTTASVADVDPPVAEPGARDGIDWANLPARVVAPIGIARARLAGRTPGAAKIGIARARLTGTPPAPVAVVPAAPLRSGRLSGRQSRRGKRQRRRADDDHLTNPVAHVPSRNGRPSPG